MSETTQDVYRASFTHTGRFGWQAHVKVEPETKRSPSFGGAAMPTKEEAAASLLKHVVQHAQRPHRDGLINAVRGQMVRDALPEQEDVARLRYLTTSVHGLNPDERTELRQLGLAALDRLTHLEGREAEADGCPACGSSYAEGVCANADCGPAPSEGQRGEGREREPAEKFERGQREFFHAPGPPATAEVGGSRAEEIAARLRAANESATIRVSPAEAGQEEALAEAGRKLRVALTYDAIEYDHWTVDSEAVDEYDAHAVAARNPTTKDTGGAG